MKDYIRSKAKNASEKIMQDEAKKLFDDVMTRASKAIAATVEKTDGKMTVESAVSTMAFTLREAEVTLFAALKRSISADRFDHVKRVYDEVSTTAILDVKERHNVN